MSRNRWTLQVEIEADQVITRGWRGGDVLRDAGMRPIYSARLKGWVLDLHRAPDVLAAVEHSGAAVVVTGQIVQKPTVRKPAVQSELDLFGGGDAA